MTKPGVYVETSVVSYLTARPSRDLIVAAQQAMTREWWRNASARFVLAWNSHRRSDKRLPVMA